MALKVTQAQVDTLTAQQAKVFRAMKDDQFTQNHLLLQDVNAAGGNMTISQLDHIGRDLVSRGFAQEDTVNGKWKYRRARITPNHVPDRSDNCPEPQTPPRDEPVAVVTSMPLLAELDKIADNLLGAEAALVDVRNRMQRAMDMAEDLETRPQAISDSELAELREKASKWDDFQKLMGRN